MKKLSATLLGAAAMLGIVADAPASSTADLRSRLKTSADAQALKAALTEKRDGCARHSLRRQAYARQVRCVDAIGRDLRAAEEKARLKEETDAAQATAQAELEAAQRANSKAEAALDAAAVQLDAISQRLEGLRKIVAGQRQVAHDRVSAAQSELSAAIAQADESREQQAATELHAAQQALETVGDAPTLLRIQALERERADRARVHAAAMATAQAAQKATLAAHATLAAVRYRRAFVEAVFAVAELSAVNAAQGRPHNESPFGSPLVGVDARDLPFRGDPRMVLMFVDRRAVDAALAIDPLSLSDAEFSDGEVQRSVDPFVGGKPVQAVAA